MVQGSCPTGLDSPTELACQRSRDLIDVWAELLSKQNATVWEGRGLLWRGLFQTVTALVLIELVEFNSPLSVRLDARISTFSNRNA